MFDPIIVEGGGARAEVYPSPTNRTRGMLATVLNALDLTGGKADDETPHKADNEAPYKYAFGVLTAQSKNVTGLDFHLPTVYSTEEEIRASYEAFMNSTNTDFGDALLDATVRIRDRKNAGTPATSPVTSNA